MKIRIAIIIVLVCLLAALLSVCFGLDSEQTNLDPTQNVNSITHPTNVEENRAESSTVEKDGNSTESINTTETQARETEQTHTEPTDAVTTEPTVLDITEPTEGETVPEETEVIGAGGPNELPRDY